MTPIITHWFEQKHQEAFASLIPGGLVRRPHDGHLLAAGQQHPTLHGHKQSYPDVSFVANAQGYRMGTATNTHGYAMGQKSQIEWTDATWNPVTGCTRLSAGCENCYAATLATRLLSEKYLSRPPQVDAASARLDPFAVRLWPERLHDPLAWRQPRHIFVNSMSDLFHKDIPEEYLRAVFEIMQEASHHTYQILTKRPGRAVRFVQRNAALFNEARLPKHIWIGTSVENQAAAYRIRQLLLVPARVRFLSCEPLIGPVVFDPQGIDWVIVGGESGIRRRSMDPEWPRQIRDLCRQAGVPFFFKQWGGRTPKAGGRKLDGREWNEMPAIADVGS
jgi:protein gp37